MNTFGLAILNSFETCRLVAYQDENGVWTIGWGDTFNVTPGMVITQIEADARREQRIDTSLALLRHYLTIYLNEDQLSALVDFVYNEGIGNFRQSDLFRKLQACNYSVEQEFLNWTRVGNKPGVLRARRQAEWCLFSGDIAGLGRILADRGTPLQPGVA